MAHKKSMLNRFFTDPEDTGDSEGNRSPIFKGNGWVIPETSHSDQDKLPNPQQKDNPTSKYFHVIYLFKKMHLNCLSKPLNIIISLHNQISLKDSYS